MLNQTRDIIKKLQQYDDPSDSSSKNLNDFSNTSLYNALNHSIDERKSYEEFKEFFKNGRDESSGSNYTHLEGIIDFVSEIGSKLSIEQLIELTKKMIDYENEALKTEKEKVDFMRGNTLPKVLLGFIWQNDHELGEQFMSTIPGKVFPSNETMRKLLEETILRPSKRYFNSNEQEFQAVEDIILGINRMFDKSKDLVKSLPFLEFQLQLARDNKLKVAEETKKTDPARFSNIERDIESIKERLNTLQKKPAGQLVEPTASNTPNLNENEQQNISNTLQKTEENRLSEQAVSKNMLQSFLKKYSEFKKQKEEELNKNYKKAYEDFIGTYSATENARRHLETPLYESKEAYERAFITWAHSLAEPIQLEQPLNTNSRQYKNAQQEYNKALKNRNIEVSLELKVLCSAKQHYKKWYDEDQILAEKVDKVRPFLNKIDKLYASGNKGISALIKELNSNQKSLEIDKKLVELMLAVDNYSKRNDSENSSTTESVIIGADKNKVLEVKAKANAVIDEIIRLKKEEKVPTKDLIEVLRCTNDLFNSNMSAIAYQSKAQKLQNKSFGLRVLGGLMIGLGLAVAAVGMSLAFSSIGLIAGVAGGTLLFGKGIQLLQTERYKMDLLNAMKELADAKVAEEPTWSLLEEEDNLKAQHGEKSEQSSPQRENQEMVDQNPDVEIKTPMETLSQEESQMREHRAVECYQGIPLQAKVIHEVNITHQAVLVPQNAVKIDPRKSLPLASTLLKISYFKEQLSEAREDNTENPNYTVKSL